MSKWLEDPDPKQKFTKSGTRSIPHSTGTVQYSLTFLPDVLFEKSTYSVADPHHFDADPDAAFHFDADPDPTFHSDADPDPQHCLHMMVICM